MQIDQSSSAQSLMDVLADQETQREQLAKMALDRGLSNFQAKKYDLAIAEFKRAASIKPGLAEAYDYLGKVYQKTGKLNAAIEAFKTGVRLNPTSEKAVTSLGNAYIEAKQYADAESQFKKLVRVSLNSAYPYNSLGHLYLLMNRYSEAEDQFKKVIQLSPNDGNGYYGLGLAYNKESKYQQAVQQFQKAIQLKKNFAYAISDLGYAYIGLGDTTKAQKQVDILNNLNPSLALELGLALYTPKIAGVVPTDSTFPTLLGPRTPVAILDPALITPNKSKTFKLTFQFNQAMDINSVQNPLNWFISKATGGTAGYYNNGITILPTKEIMLSPVPLNVSYDPKTYKASLFFTITQNSTGDGVMDPSHWVFQFTGKDISGHLIDKAGDEYDGFAGVPF